MEITPIVNKRARQSAIVLSNATELVSQVVLGVVGNDVSDAINGNRLTGTAIKTLVQTRFMKNLTKVKG